MTQPQIRALAICLFSHGDRIFVGEGRDEFKGETFYRPLGGRIEFGERSRDTLVRELREEAGLEITNLHYLFTMENLFTYAGELGHEIVLVYDGEFVDRSVYDVDYLDCNEHVETPHGEPEPIPFRAMWKRLDEFSNEEPLYPAGLLEQLKEQEPVVNR